MADTYDELTISPEKKLDWTELRFFFAKKVANIEYNKKCEAQAREELFMISTK